MKRSVVILALLCACLVFIPRPRAFAEESAPAIDVSPRRPIALKTTALFDFADEKTSIAGWFASPGTTLARGERALVATSTELDPHFLTPELQGIPAGLTLVKLRVRRSTWDDGRLYYEERGRGIDEERSIAFLMTKEPGIVTGGPIPDATPFRDYVVPVESETPITRLRFDLGNSEGRIELERVELVSVLFDPLRFGPATLEEGVLSVALENLGDAPLTVDVDALGFAAGESVPTTTIEARQKQTFRLRYPQEDAFETLELIATARETGSVARRRFFAFNESACEHAPGDYCSVDRSIVLSNDELAVRFARDGAGAEIFRGETRVAVLAPLLCEEGDGADLIEPSIVDEDSAREAIERPESSTRLALEFAGYHDGAPGATYRVVARPRDGGSGNAEVVGSLELRLEGDRILYSVDCDRKVHAPVLRVLGKMKQAVLPGVEFLEEGDRSSSNVDLFNAKSVRFAPPSLWLTQSYAAIVTDRGSVAATFDDPKARVLFAVPDFIDGDDDSSRFNVCANKVSGAIRIAAPEPLENAILCAVQTLGLPDPPVPARRGRELEDFLLSAFRNSAIATPEGWIYTVFRPEPPQKFPPSYGSDFLSTIVGISGELPQTPRVDVGGAFLHDCRSLFLSQNAQKLRDYLVQTRRQILAQQQEDGSFRYQGRFLKDGVKDYASGYGADKLCQLLDDWRLTGDSSALDAALKGLAFANRLKTPRGAQTWEIPIHTPDLYAASQCARANVLAYEATGDNEYLAAARRWAIDALPFVYLWQDETLAPWRDYPEGPADPNEPIMKYASIAVLGATEGNLTSWLGRPVQWCGLDYAYALILLSKHDKTLDWRTLADGIVSCAELQLHDGATDSSFNGLLPDSVDPETQKKYGGFFNPVSVWILRNMLEGREHDASVVDVAGRRVAAPFPMRVDQERRAVVVSGRKGVVYDVMIDGTEIRTIESQGEDEIEF